MSGALLQDLPHRRFRLARAGEVIRQVSTCARQALHDVGDHALTVFAQQSVTGRIGGGMTGVAGQQFGQLTILLALLL